MKMNLYAALAVSLVGVGVMAQQKPAEPGSVETRLDTQKQPIQAEAQLQPGSQPQLEKAGSISSFNRASTVLGMAVKDGSGKELGQVKDLVFDLENSRLGYAVVLLAGDRLVPVPVSALKPAESKDHLVLNMSESVLAAASGVSNDDWPALDAFAVGGPAQTEKGEARSKE